MSVNLLFVFKYIYYYINMLFVKVIHICKSNIGEQNPWHGKYRWCCCMKGFQWICAFLSWSKLKLILQEVSYCQLLEPAYTCREIERWQTGTYCVLFQAGYTLNLLLRFTEQEQEGRGSPKVPLRTGEQWVLIGAWHLLGVMLLQCSI